MFIRNGKATGSILVRDLDKSEAVESLPLVEPEPVEVADEVVVEQQPEPDIDWLRDDLDKYAAAMKRPLDTTDLPNKAAVLEAIRDNTTE